MTETIHIMHDQRRIIAGTVEEIEDRHGNPRWWAETRFPKRTGMFLDGTEVLESAAMFWSSGGAKLWVELRAMVR